MQPPGTGKTLTIISTIKLLKAFFQVPQPLLVCTYTNVAVDNLVEGLAKAGLKPLRAASAGKTKASLGQWTLEYQLEQHPSYPKWKDLEDRTKKLVDEMKELKNKIRKLEGSKLSSRDSEIRTRMMEGLAQKGRSLGTMKKRSYGLEQAMTRDILNNADVVGFFQISFPFI